MTKIGKNTFFVGLYLHWGPSATVNLAAQNKNLSLKTKTKQNKKIKKSLKGSLKKKIFKLCLHVLVCPGLNSKTKHVDWY